MPRLIIMNMEYSMKATGCLWERLGTFGFDLIRSFAFITTEQHDENPWIPAYCKRWILWILLGHSKDLGLTRQG